MSSQEQLILNFLEDIVHALRCPDWTAKILEGWYIAQKRSPTPDLAEPQEEPPERNDSEHVENGATANHRESSHELERSRAYDMTPVPQKRSLDLQQTEDEPSHDYQRGRDQSYHIRYGYPSSRSRHIRQPHHNPFRRANSYGTQSYFRGRYRGNYTSHNSYY